MGTMTLADYRTELPFLLKNRADAAVTTSRLDRWVNAAYRHMTHPSVHKHWEAMGRYDLALVAGTREYSLSTATVGYSIVGVRDVTYYLATAIANTTMRRDLRPRSLHWINQRSAPLGAPTGYSFDYSTGRLLTLDTQPTSNESGHMVRVSVWRELTALSAATDATVLSDYWDRVLLKGAQWLAELDLGYREIAEATKQDYVGLIGEMWNDFQLNADDTGFQTPVRTESPMEYS